MAQMLTFCFCPTHRLGSHLYVCFYLDFDSLGVWLDFDTLYLHSFRP